VTPCCRVAAACALASVLLPGGGNVRAAEPKDTIKQAKLVVNQIAYRGDNRKDPFEPLVPLKSAQQGKNWKVRVASLRLSSVITGKQKVAIFKELHGPTFSYILVNGVLLGPDHNPIPGVAGTIEESRDRPGEYRVVLTQGADKIEFTLINKELSEKRSAREQAKSARSGQGK